MNQKEKKITLFFPKLEENKPYHWFPMSLLSISAVIKEAGFKAVIIDERVDSDWEEKLITECKTSIILGVSSFTGYQLKGAYYASKLIKKLYPEIKIMWGGPHISSLPFETLEDSNIDIGVIGYGDIVTKDVIDRVYNNQSLKGLNGVIYKNNGELLGNPISECKPDFSKLPQIDYNIIDIKKYINPETQAFTYISSYGCPGICTFCSTKTLRGYMKLNSKKIITDIQSLLSLYPFKKLVMYDATFFVDEPNVKDIVSYIKKSGIKEWVCDGRAVDIMRLSDNTLELCEKSNLKHIVIGLETGSQKIVEEMKKGKKHLETYKKSVERLKNYKINILSGVIFGMPNETIDDLKQTLTYLEEVKQINPNVKFSTTFFQALPGTELFEYVKNVMNIKFPSTLEEWAKYGETNHYVYNHSVKTQYLDASIRDEYLNIYEEFWSKHEDWRA